ncbi:hypothetical protein FMEAI12_3640048 [Parafrankia sp. Ea1.12]|nr:hypothetical protein FMEAI12_3640048 [Parafrankia sp. Ea1.12]
MPSGTRAVRATGAPREEAGSSHRDFEPTALSPILLVRGTSKHRIRGTVLLCSLAVLLIRVAERRSRANLADHPPPDRPDYAGDPDQPRRRGCPDHHPQPRAGSHLPGRFRPTIRPGHRFGPS